MSQPMATAAVPVDQAQVILIPHSHFEKTALNLLAKLFPDLGDGMNGLADRLVDLLPLTRQHYYHPAMKGSRSVKAVLPIAAPDLDYGAFEVSTYGRRYWYGIPTQ